ncbi:MAG: cation transporter [Ruminococcaceae bacterium]|nr:cation transporter [Oscillospiraceae bacterium]
MRTDRNILIAFILNLAFSVFEFVGGIVTGSIAIASDAVHDLGDAVSIGVSYVLERKSKHPANRFYTYGFARYSVLGSIITTLILLFGSAVVICNAVLRIINPVEIDYRGMILFAVVGVIVNTCAAFFTRGGQSLNQRAVNLHMLEDVLGWVVVLCGAVVMHFTDLAIIDPVMSMGVAVFILVHAVKNLTVSFTPLLERTPGGVDIAQLKARLEQLDGVLDVHHVHLWTLDGQTNCATLHLVTDADPHPIKLAARQVLAEFHIGHATLELEVPGEDCPAVQCPTVSAQGHHHHHHHHHH